MDTKRPWKYYTSLLFYLIAPLFALAQQVTFEAYSDTRQTVLNSYIEVSFTLKNGDGNNFKAPSFNHFTVISGPSRSVSTSIINGVVSKELSYIYTLQPKKMQIYNIQ